MCDYSLESVASRPAKVGDKLVSTSFPGTTTRGFSAVGEPNMAVCLLPGTEIAFDKEIECEGALGFLATRKLGQTLARFRHINEGHPHMHHDALEVPDGRMVLLTLLRHGQYATVLQLPADSAADTHDEKKQESEEERRSYLDYLTID
ncbi:hypothetical protein [Flaviflagellibacter deserti]|jgi:hypothetical protein|uniref:Uncharacterized protein n=1 Tax=Flaviflagellibacter deserti TaxID=2267266 RepID=A0ABV9YZL5_9HYPH